MARPVIFPLLANKYEKSVHIETLCAKDDEAFVRGLYEVVLRREPDPEGFAHYLRLVRSGAKKRTVVRDMRYSKEGQAITVPLIGLGGISFVSKFGRCVIDLIRFALNSRDRRIRENRMVRISEHRARDLDTLSKTISASLSQVEVAHNELNRFAVRGFRENQSALTEYVADSFTPQVVATVFASCIEVINQAVSSKVHEEIEIASREWAKQRAMDGSLADTRHKFLTDVLANKLDRSESSVAGVTAQPSGEQGLCTHSFLSHDLALRMAGDSTRFIEQNTPVQAELRLLSDRLDVLTNELARLRDFESGKKIIESVVGVLQHEIEKKADRAEVVGIRAEIFQKKMSDALRSDSSMERDEFNALNLSADWGKGEWMDRIAARDFLRI